MGGHSQCFVAEKDSILTIQTDNVAAKKIVGIFVPDGDTKSSVAFQNIIFE